MFETRREFKLGPWGQRALAQWGQVRNSSLLQRRVCCCIPVYYNVVSVAANGSLTHHQTDSVDVVMISPTAQVFNFRDAVCKKNQPSLPGIVARHLKVFINAATCSAHLKNAVDHAPLEIDSFIAELGKTKESALVVLVPALHQGILYLILE
jgi:hypothetical protein